MNNDFPLSFYDEVGGRLWEGGLAAAKGVRSATKITCLIFGPPGDSLTEVCDECVFVLGWLANGPGVGDMFIVLVQGTLEEVKVPAYESYAPFLDEPDLWGNGHCDEATGG
jgi:hypothetical protein